MLPLWKPIVHCRRRCRSLFSCSFVEAGRLVYMALVVRVTSASVMLWWVWDGLSSLAICRVAAPLWLMTLRYHTSLLLNGPFGVSLWRCMLWFVHIPMPFSKLFLLSLFVFRAECNWHPLGSAQEQAYCSSRTYYLSTSTWLLNSCRRSLFSSCALMGIAAHSSQHFKSHALADGIVIAMSQCYGWRNYHLHGSCRQSLFRCDLLEVAHSPWQYLKSLLCKWSVHRRRHYSSRWLLPSESLQLFFRGSGTARLHGSCRQSDFSFSYALVGVGRLVISGNMSSCSSSVADDAAISHVSTVEWAFWGESLALHVVIRSHTDAIL